MRWLRRHVEFTVDTSIWVIPCGLMVTGEGLLISVLCLHMTVEW